MKKIASLFFFLILLSCSILSQIKEISPQKAYQKLKNSSTYLIDVRSVAEYVFVGHPEVAFNIPIKFWGEKEQKLIPNENFLQSVKSRFKNDDVLIFICRSGGRSLEAAKLANQEGFKKVFSIKTGFEGEKDEQGLRTLNGWKNRELPYTYKVKEELKYRLPKSYEEK